MYFIYLAFD